MWVASIGWDWTWSTVWPQINTAFAEYNMFGVMSENNKYELIFDSYSGKSLSFVINGGSVNIWKIPYSFALRSIIYPKTKQVLHRYRRACPRDQSKLA